MPSTTVQVFVNIRAMIITTGVGLVSRPFLTSREFFSFKRTETGTFLRKISQPWFGKNVLLKIAV